MTIHLHRDLEALKSSVLAMGGVVEQALELSLRAVMSRQREPAEIVAHGDDAIDERELQLEEDCLKALALHQPVAGDLRFIVAIMKVNNDLERVGDLALNIAERALDLLEKPPLPQVQDLQPMAEMCSTMLRESLDSLVNQDPEIARRVIATDERVDEMHAERFRQVQDLMRESPDRIDAATQILSLSRYLERIADHATNIAEDVVFMIDGAIIRHQHEDAAEGRWELSCERQLSSSSSIFTHSASRLISAKSRADSAERNS